MVRVMVSGGAGFLGSHLCERLVADGHEVVCLDNLSTGRRRNVEHLMAAGAFSFVEADVVDPFPLEGPFDGVYHLASPVGTAYPPAADGQGLAQPIAALRVGAEGTRRMLDLADECGAVFVLASTSEVYGDPDVHPQAETYPGRVNPVGPRSSYSEGKRFAEALTKAYARQRGLRTRIARIFNTYGPRMRPEDSRVIPHFIVQALTGRPLTVDGTGEQTRSFCYVSDMVEALVRLAEADVEDPVNLGNPDEVSILALAREILELADSASPIEFGPMREGDPSRRRPDIRLARRVLDWEPRTSRREGLARTIQYYRKEEPLR